MYFIFTSGVTADPAKPRIRSTVSSSPGSAMGTAFRLEASHWSYR